MISITKTKLYRFMTSHKEPLFRASLKKTPTFFCTKNSKILVNAFFNNKKAGIANKLFYFTANSQQRIANIPTEKITGGKLISLKEKAGETGYVYFEDGINFVYCITKAGIHIMSSHGKHETIFRTEEGIQSMVNMVSGYIYMDFYSDTLDYWINNVFDIANKDHLLAKDEHLKGLLNKMEKTDSIAIAYKEDFNIKWNDTITALRGFLFIFLAKVLNTTKISCDNDSIKFSEKIFNKTQMLDVIRIDSFYDESMTVINPFAVTGHFRNQPIGIGRSETKLIYIDSFMKTGYTRDATKIKEHI